MESEEQFQQSLADVLVEETSVTVNVWVKLASNPQTAEVCYLSGESGCSTQMETESAILTTKQDLFSTISRIYV